MYRFRLSIKSQTILGSILVLMTGGCRTTASGLDSSQSAKAPTKDITAFSTTGNYTGPTTQVSNVWIKMTKALDPNDRYKGFATVVDVDTFQNDVLEFIVTASQYQQLFEGTDKIDQLSLFTGSKDYTSTASASSDLEQDLRVVEVANSYKGTFDAKRRSGSVKFSIQGGALVGVDGTAETGQAAGDNKKYRFTSAKLEKTKNGVGVWENLEPRCKRATTAYDIGRISDAVTLPSASDWCL